MRDFGAGRCPQEQATIRWHFMGNTAHFMGILRAPKHILLAFSRAPRRTLLAFSWASRRLMKAPHKPKACQWMPLDHLRHVVHLLAGWAVEARGSACNELHVATALATLAEHLARGGQRGEACLKEVVHAGDVGRKKLELLFKLAEAVRNDGVLVSLALQREGGGGTRTAHMRRCLECSDSQWTIEPSLSKYIHAWPTTTTR